MPIFPCPVTWPTEATQATLIPPYARPDHECKLDADHIHVILEGEAAPWPHTCACGEQLAVRDVEVAR